MRADLPRALWSEETNHFPLNQRMYESSKICIDLMSEKRSHGRLWCFLYYSFKTVYQDE